MVVGGCRREFHIARNALIAVDTGMYLHAALLLPCLGISSDALEYEVGEEANGRGIDYLELLHPFGHLAGAAVR